MRSCISITSKGLNQSEQSLFQRKEEESMSQDVTYKGHTIRIEPHQDQCSEYAYVILDAQGNEIKHVTMGGDTQDRAVSNAKEMIDFEERLKQE